MRLAELPENTESREVT